MAAVVHTLKQRTVEAGFLAVQLLPEVWDWKLTPDFEQCFRVYFSF